MTGVTSNCSQWVLLLQATRLKVLCTTGVSVIAPVLGLTHLVISNVGPDFQSLSQALPLFMSLETLSLGGSSAKT